MEDITILRDKYDILLKKAETADAMGNNAIAYRNYMLAAETMLKIAKTSTPELKKVQIKRANDLVARADLIGNTPQAPRRAPQRPQQGQGNADASTQRNEDDDEGKEWVGADIPNVSFKDVAGLEDVKKTIMTRMINPILYPDKYAKYGKKIGGGVLLYGPPGTGKTFIAKAIAGEVGATFYAIKGSDIMSKYVGESEKNISSLFEAARGNKLSIIFIDEMDSLFGERGKDIHNDKRVNEFLQQIDGFASKIDNLLILGATNRPWDVDSAAVRSGRFSEKIYVPLPDAKAREFMFRHNLENVPLGKDLDFDKLVGLTDGYSGADIAEVCDRAKEEPLNIYIKTDVEEPVSMKYILDAIKKVRPTVSKLEIRRFEEYAGIKKEDKVEDSNLVEDELRVKFALTQIKLLPNKKPKLEFVLNKDVDKVYLSIGGANYVCTKKLASWESEPLNIDAGTYDAIITSKNLIAREKITFIKGLEEEDLGL